MPAISKIRFTNVIYENGRKRYNDEIFQFDGHNTALLLENGGGKTVFIQAVMQAIIPHMDMAERKIKDTLSLENAPAHIAIEWILNDKPRRYALTVATLFMENNQLNSLKYTYDYAADDTDSIDEIPFTMNAEGENKRPASRGEMSDYYKRMSKQSLNAHVFSSIKEYGKYIENNYKIIPSEWRKIAVINSGEGNVDEFFNKCKTTEQLLNNLLIPVVEEAIEGAQSAEFVKTFEKQREHFKKNRILQDKIEQSQKVKEQIDDYVKVYADYEDERMTLMDIKREAKTLTNYVTNQIKLKQDELVFNETNIELLNKETNQLKQKLLTHEFMKKEQELLQHEEHYKALMLRLEQQQQEFDKLASRKQNIELTRQMKDIKETQEQIEFLNEELKNSDIDSDSESLKKQLDENSAYIKGYFTYELELIEREMIRIDEGYKEAEHNYKRTGEELRSTQKYEKEMIGKRSQLAAKLEYIEGQKKELEEDLFKEEVPMGTTLFVEQLEQQQQSIEKQRLASETRLIDCKQNNRNMLHEFEKLNSQIIVEKEKLRHYEIKKEAINQASKQLVDEIELSGHNLYLTGSIYSKEESIIKDLEERREAGYIKKEKALKTERIYFREADMYETLSCFVVESKLESMVETLKQKTSFVALGTNYIQTVKDGFKLSELELFERYPFWALTIVTSVSDEEQVGQYVKKLDQELQSMVMVITIENLNKILKKEMSVNTNTHIHTYYPKSWSDNLNPDNYYKWQQQIIERAQDHQELRKQKEAELKISDHVLEGARSYFSDYPYSVYTDITDTIIEKTALLKELYETIKELKIHQSKEEESIRLLETEIQKYYETKRTSEQILLKAVKLLELEEMYIQCDDEHKESVLINHKVNLELSVLHEAINLTANKLKDIKEEEYKFLREEDKIRDNELFVAIGEFEAIGTNIGIETLKKQRISFERRLSGLNSSQAVIEERMNQQKDLLNRYREEHEQKVREARYEVQEIKRSYDKELENIYDKMLTLEGWIKKVLKEQKDSEEVKIRLQTKLEIVLRQLEMDYQGKYIFDEAYRYIENKLKIEKATLKDREKKLFKEKKAIEAAIKLFELTNIELQVKDGAYNFLFANIVPIIFEVDYFEEFDENPEYIVKKLLSRLEGQSKIATKAFNQVENKQEDIMVFCHECIDDHRLRDTVIKGIQHKDNYKELLVYQEKMTEIIMKTIRVAEDDKRESDLELQTFLSHLLTYVKTVSTELDLIQNKTRITIDDQVKQIFIFNIPVWDEEEAKIHLREYVDETIDYFESESMHKDYNEAVLSKSIEDRLSVKNLLKVVMHDQSIKIKCRKVTNDMQVNKVPVIWESTIKWSGGEKWSKNMTLFLSILNYLSEKKQHLSENQKSHRSVILDNPFGKASSKHVLKPVFMIAKKLGFQIIALTAHAEGQYISDYFPVVYSCRLRQTKDASKQIMVNERVLNYAYLRENAPMTIMRMQEVEQLNIFD